MSESVPIERLQALAALSAKDWIVVIAFGAALAVLAYGMPRIWRGELRPDRDLAPPGWALGEPLWRGIGRAIGPPLLLIGAVMVSAFALDRAMGDDVPSAIQLTSRWAPLIGGLYVAAIALFNRPRWLLPPAVRHQPGALAEWRQRQGGRAPGSGT